ncbi:hypothetical protein [Streptomyces sp. 3214.6]|uniref:hypothetical protein n=1 Tax=Streptomyces sp. 3214.6 TaxID=1882757 RepID=UPI00117C63CD|nr:hypothetical protein [Streptomyces sp. 3214.6]
MSTIAGHLSRKSSPLRREMGCQRGLVASSAGLFAEDAGTRDPAVDADWPHEHAAGSFETVIEAS